ncbi:MAG TPA: hypothetical protein DCZ00_04340 [Lactococcus sp.]|uniref:hypothetical protein n=1 Tax=Lactococcus TaxID=1357 RepID=UPI000E9630BE|nr:MULTISPECIES: hypothetical protein [Lactococcus]HBC90658.1 hypothetical protein [Lactococcus sp.]
MKENSIETSHNVSLDESFDNEVKNMVRPCVQSFFQKMRLHLQRANNLEGEVTIALTTATEKLVSIAFFLYFVKVTERET